MTRSALCLAVLIGVAAIPADAAIAVKFFGEATAGNLSPEVQRAVEESGIDLVGYDCFEAPLLDLETDRQIGTGVDCLRVFDAGGDAAGQGLQLDAKTFFLLPQGTIVNHGCTSVRPFFSGVGDAGVTHVTGSIGPRELGGSFGENAPVQCAEANGILLATRGFARHTGEVRLSGAVNLSRAGEGIITFSCIFVIDLQPPGRS